MAETYKNETGLAAELRAQYGLTGPIISSGDMISTSKGVFAVQNGKVTAGPMSFQEWQTYDRDLEAQETVDQFAELGYEVDYNPATGMYKWTNPITGKQETTQFPFNSAPHGFGGKPGWWEQALTASGDTSSTGNPWYTNPDGSPGILTVDEDGNRGTYPGGTNPTSGGAGSGGGTTGGGGGGGGTGGGGGYGPPTPTGGGWTPPTPGGGYNPRGPAGGSTSPFRPSGSFTGPAAGSIYGGTSENGEYPTPPGLPGIPGNPFPIPPGQKAQEFKPYGEAVGEFSQMRSYGGLPRSTGPWGEMGGYYGGNPYGNTDPRLPPPPPTLPSVPGYTPPNTTPTTLIGGHISTGDFYGTRPGEYRPGISVPGPNPSTSGTPPTGSGPPRDIPDEDEVFPHPGTNLPPPYDPGDGPITEPDIDFEYIPPGGTTTPPPVTPPPAGGGGGGGNKPGPQRPNSAPISMTSYGTGAPGSYEAMMAYLLANGVT